MAAILQALNLTKAYDLGGDRVHAVNDVSLEVYPGEMVAVGGYDGSGKSTLLHILGCLQRPDSGQVFLEGQDVTQLDDEALAEFRNHKVGFLFQEVNILPTETVLGNVEIPLQYQGEEVWDRRQKAEKALEVVGLENHAHHDVGELSAVQRQCIAIARAMVHRPAVILADEPTRNLDSKSGEQIMGLFQKINDAGMTIILSTAQSSVASYCRRIVKMTDGRAVGDGPVSKRRIIRPSRIPGAEPESFVKEEKVVCPWCSYGNPIEESVCQQCNS